MVIFSIQANADTSKMKAHRVHVCLGSSEWKRSPSLPMGVHIRYQDILSKYIQFLITKGIYFCIKILGSYWEDYTFVAES